MFQRHEPPELVHVLGGKIAIRQVGIIIPHDVVVMLLR